MVAILGAGVYWSGFGDGHVGGVDCGVYVVFEMEVLGWGGEVRRLGGVVGGDGGWMDGWMDSSFGEVRYQYTKSTYTKHGM